MTDRVDHTDSPEFRAFAKEVRSGLIPKLKDSAATLSIIPEGELDVKFAVELGMSVMLDKPLIAVVQPGVKIPDKLARVVDRFIEWDKDTDVLGEAIRRAFDEVIKP